MNEGKYRKILVSVLALAGIFAARPAPAELDLSGDWVSYGHEDSLERGNGPAAVDYFP